MLSRYMEIGEMPEAGSVPNGVNEANSVTEGLFTALNASPYQSQVTYTKNSPRRATFAVTLTKINGNVNTKTLSFEFIDENPELSYKEFKTSDYIAEVLTSLEIPFHRGLGGTGIVASIKGKQDGDSIGLRADIDALPVDEANDFDSLHLPTSGRR